MSDPTTAASQDNPLLEVILSLLAPLLMAGGVTDLALARRAAQQAIAAYNDGQGQLITIAQIVGFAIAALDNLRLSASPDLSVTAKLRLRGNANALNRSTERSQLALGRHEVPDMQSRKRPLADPAPQADPPPASDTDRQRELAWANAMTDVAAECSRGLGRLSPTQRRQEILRIAALNATARQLQHGTNRDDQSGPATPRQHARQQPVPQHDPMIQRARQAQPDDHQRNSARFMRTSPI